MLRVPTLLRDRCLVDGRWIDSSNEARIEVKNPADGTVVGTVPILGAEEVRQAIAAAQRALGGWSRLTARDRAAILKRWHGLVLDNLDDLAVLMTAEQGKPLAEARGEIQYAASFIEWFAEEAKRAYGEIIPSPLADRRLMVLGQPVGVCAAITPWNFPAAMITRKAAPAMAAGCTIIIKPAEQTPLSALALAELAMQAGIPAGVFQVVTGDPKIIGGLLTESSVVRKLSFTGSTEVGRILMAQCAPTIKRLSLELGGNAPFIVFDDADLDAAVEGALASKYRNAGQTCVCTNRFYVQSSIYESFAKRLTERVAELSIGPGDQSGVQIGPLIDAEAVAKVEAYIADALAHGAKIEIGGRRGQQGPLFYEPTVLSGVTQAMRVAREEIFGPVAPLFSFDSEEEVIAMANATEYGLAAYFYTLDARRAWRVTEALEYGMVGHNTGLISNEVAPFGGIKQSGVGREGSRHGMEEYQELKYWCSVVE